MKKWISLCLAAAAIFTLAAGCGKNGDGAESISVLTREKGSGTRGAFIELLGIEEKNADGEKVDQTLDSAEQTNSTAVMMTTVAGNESAIGYISLGALQDTVKALKIDGVEATVETVKNGTYQLARPFNVATKATISDGARDFLAFILSDAGQQVVEDNGYISQGSTGSFTSIKPSGKVVVAGSSSVSPVMQKLIEAYNTVNAGLDIQLQQNDSSSGMTAAMEGTCDIGMASRELKDSEKQGGLTATVIAMDGIAVIVHPDNPVSQLTSAQVKDIYTGALTAWSDVK